VRNIIIVVVALAAAGCKASPVATPPPPVDPCRNGEVLCITPSTIKNKVDMLFVLDDSPTMAAALGAWRASLPHLVSKIGSLADVGSPVSFHFGAITADLGAGPETLAALGCHPGGDNGKLHSGNVALTGGVRFVDDNQLAGTTNFTGDLAAALDALSDVGTSGCAFPSPLEAAYRALHDFVPENAAFLRSDALLVVVFVTNGDDCSAPATSDLSDPSSTKYGALDRFRCTQFGIACGGNPVPPMAVSGLTGCESQTMASGGKLIDVQKYVDFFDKPAAQGGVKVDPQDVILAGVTAPIDPVGVTITSPCAADASVASCPQLNHSCESPSDPRFFGDPAVRLDAVIASARTNDLVSVCSGSDDSLVDSIRNALFSRASAGCLQTPLAARSDGTADCLVDDVTAHADGSTTVSDVPSCAENGHVIPCWDLVDRLPQYDAQGCMPSSVGVPATCKLPLSCQPVTGADGKRELYSLDIDRGLTAAGTPNPAPPGTTTHIECATIPTP